MGLAASFAVIWLPLLPVAIQFPVVLCLYDSFLTAVDVVQSALLADLEHSDTERANLSMYKSAFSAVGAASVFLSSQFWDTPSLFLIDCPLEISSFRLLCVPDILSCSCMCFPSWLCCVHELSEVDIDSNDAQAAEE